MKKLGHDEQARRICLSLRDDHPTAAAPIQCPLGRVPKVDNLSNSSGMDNTTQHSLKISSLDSALGGIVYDSQEWTDYTSILDEVLQSPPPVVNQLVLQDLPMDIPVDIKIDPLDNAESLLHQEQQNAHLTSLLSKSKKEVRYLMSVLKKKSLSKNREDARLSTFYSDLNVILDRHQQELRRFVRRQIYDLH